MEFTGDNVNHSTSYYEQNVRKASQVFRVLIIKFCYFSKMTIDIQCYDNEAAKACCLRIRIMCLSAYYCFSELAQ